MKLWMSGNCRGLFEIVLPSAARAACAVLLCVLAGRASGATYDVSGQVVTPDGQAVAGATVYHYRLSYVRSEDAGVQAKTLTDANGGFELKGVTYNRDETVYDSIIAVAKGYGLAAWRARSTTPGAIMLRLAEPGVLKGVVRDEDGKPASDAGVVIHYLRFRSGPTLSRAYLTLDSEDPLPELTAKADAEGRFAIAHLPQSGEGYVRVHVRHGDFAVALEKIELQNLAKEAAMTLETGGCIDGKVTFEKDGPPAAGVRVVASARIGNTSLTESAATDKSGRYVIKNLPVADYTVRVAMGRDGKWTAAPKTNLAVVPSETTKGVDLALVSGGFIAGRVVEAGTDKPVPGVTVYAYATGVSRLRAKTEPDGSFRLRCAPGTYRVEMSSVPRGYAKPAWSDRRSVAVGEEQDAIGLKFELTKGITLTGKVIDREGKPVPRVRVTARVLFAMGSRSEYATTDTRGAFSLHGIPPNTAVGLRVTDTARELGGKVQIEVGNEPPKDVVLALSPLAFVTGRVVDREGNPVNGASVRLYEHPGRSTSSSQSTRTGADGRYRFGVVPGTRISVRVGSQYTSRGPRSRTITVAAEQRHEMRDLVSKPSLKAIISGVVKDADGKPVARARLTTTVEWRQFKASSNKRGEFEFPEIQTEGNPVRIAARDSTGLLAGQTTIMPTEANTNVTVNLSKAGAVTGRTVDEAGKPIAGAEVSAYVARTERSYSSDRKATTDKQGRFRIAGLVPEMKGYVSATAAGRGRKSSQHMTFQAGQTIEIEDMILLKADSFIAGTVRDAEGKPLPGAQVHCYGRGSDSKYVRTDAKGRFRIEGIPKIDGLYVRAYRTGYRTGSRRNVAAGSTNVDITLASRRPTTAAVAKPAPEPALATWLNTPPLKLELLRGKVVLVHFWSMRSEACVASIQTLRTLHTRFMDLLIVVAIHDRSASINDVQAFARENDLRFPIAFVRSTQGDGRQGQTFTAYKVKSLPASFVIDAKGILRHANVTEGIEQKVAALIEE